MTTPEAAEPTPSDAGGSWREMAVARSLDPARVRAEKRVQRFLDAALELMNSSPDKEFTVQEVVERSGQSLRSFYQYFAGKHELLLALFEESVRSTTEQLRSAVAEEHEPLERIHRFATEYYAVCMRTAKGRQTKKAPAFAMAEFAQQLLTSHPKEAAQAFGPLVILFEELLGDAATAGVIRGDLRHDRVAGIVLQAIMFNAFATTISGQSARTTRSDGSEELWELLMHGIGVNS